MTPSAIDRFWGKVNKGGPIPIHDPELGNCWEWVGAKRGKYGSFWHDGKMAAAHRFSYEMMFGPMPNGMLGLHRCDNALCVRPTHIYPGTQSDNITDAVKRGRHFSQRRVLKGKDHPYFKLTREEQEKFCHARRVLSDVQVKVLLRMHFVFGVPKKELIALFGISKSAFQKMKNGKTAQARQLLASIGK